MKNEIILFLLLLIFGSPYKKNSWKKKKNCNGKKTQEYLENDQILVEEV
jgi:hypothetical protein